MIIKYTSFSMQKRLLALILLIIFFLTLLCGRLFFLQVICGKSLQAKALSQWLRDVPIDAIRGTITDRNGVVLASDETSYNVYVRPADIENKEAVASVLSRNLGIEYDEVYEKVSKKGVSEISVAKKISHETMQNILKEYCSGIIFAQTSTRHYAYDSLLAQVLGFVSVDGDGQAGLEAYYNKYLKGTNGFSLLESDIKGKTLDTSSTYYIEAIDGLNIELTIDFKIQEAVEKIIAEAQTSTGAKTASAIVMSPKTGEIIATAISPSVNLNDLPRDDVSLLMGRIKNIIVSDAYEPGSTFKVITAAIALNEGLTNEHDYFYCSGSRVVNGVRIHCHRRTGHGSQSLADGLSNSCNCVFMELINRIGLEKFYAYLKLFGLTTGYNLDFPGEARAITMVQNKVTQGDLLRMGFGQSIAVTRLGLATSVCSCINGGELMQPYLAKKISTTDGNILYCKEPVVLNKTVSESVSKTLNKLLENVVSKGGGKRAAVAGHSIAGKTGTAQKNENGAIVQGKYVASFLGYTPADDPEYLVLVTIDEPQGAYYGGVIAAPVAKQIFEKIFEIRMVEANANLEAERKALEANIKVPNLIGKSLTEAVTTLSGLGLQYLVSGEGKKVSSQIAEPDSLAFLGDIVLLIME
ncbi:MAG: PASTA domain-containing protein [Clostridia bacterium]|nr:PASTA domain-containing protein [Clostridia bacterium]